MKLFPFPSDHHEPARTSPEHTEAPWQTLVLLCENCKGGRHGLDARAIRKGLKQRIGKSKSLRVLECDCLDVCPDHAVATCVVRARGNTQVCVVRSESELDELARVLRGP